MPSCRKPPGRPVSRAVVSTQLRNLLTSGEHTLFAVARDSRVPLSSLTRFVSGERDLKLATLDQLADVLGLRLVETGKDRIKPSKSPRPTSVGQHRRISDSVPPDQTSSFDQVEAPGVSTPRPISVEPGADLGIVGGDQ